MPNRIDVLHISVADAANPSITLPNVIPAHAEALRFTARVREAPAGTTLIAMKVQIFHVGVYKVGATGTFRVRLPYTTVHETPQPQPYDPARINDYTVDVPHPSHDKFSATGSPLYSRLASLMLPELGALWDKFWHDDPGPYDAAITLTPMDATPALLAGAEPITYSYGFTAI